MLKNKRAVIIPERDDNNELTSDSKKKLLNLLELVRTEDLAFSTIVYRDRYRVSEIKKSINEITDSKIKEQLLPKFEILLKTIERNSDNNRKKRKIKYQKDKPEEADFRKKRLNDLLQLVAIDKRSFGTITKTYNYSWEEVRMAINEVQNQEVKSLLFKKWENFVNRGKQFKRHAKKNKQKLSPTKQNKSLKNSAEVKVNALSDSLKIPCQVTGACSTTTVSSELLPVNAVRWENNYSNNNLQVKICKYFSNSQIDEISNLIVSNSELLSLANEELNGGSCNHPISVEQPVIFDFEKGNNHEIFANDFANFKIVNAPLSKLTLNNSKPQTCINSLPVKQAAVVFDNDYYLCDKSVVDIPQTLVLPTNAIVTETRVANTFDCLQQELTTIEPPNTEETQLLTIFDFEKGYNHEVLVNDFSDFRSYNMPLQQSPVNSSKEQTAPKVLQPKQPPISTEMNWVLFEATDNIPPTLATHTNTTFDERITPSDVINTNKELNAQEINETSFNAVATSKNTFSSYFYY